MVKLLPCLRQYGGYVGSRIRLVCFPWAGAGASVYRDFGKYLPDNIAVSAVQLPGREDLYSEKFLFRIENIVDYILKELSFLQDKPLVLFGHSMGALVAYEVALALKRNVGREPDLLIVSGSISSNSDIETGRCRAHASDAELISELRLLGGTPEPVLQEPELMQALLPVIRADYEVMDKYQSDNSIQLRKPLIACAGENDPRVPESGLYEWATATTGICKTVAFSGGHFYFMGEKQERAFCTRLASWLDQYIEH